MEGVPETPKREIDPKTEPYVETGVVFRNQLMLFESMHSPESFKTVPDAIYGFASFIRTQSEKVLEGVRALQTGNPEKQRDEYKLEQAAAKLHAFNMANAETLHMYAEVLAESEESAELQRTIFPWLRSIDAWATRYVRTPDVNT
jgi:hypothetical protein